MSIRISPRASVLLPLGLVALYAAAALVYGFATTQQPLTGPAPGFFQLATRPWLAGGAILLTVLAAADYLRPSDQRARRLSFWGGVLWGVGISVALTSEPALGCLLCATGGLISRVNDDR